MVGIASAAIYSILIPISEATGLTLGDLNAGTGYMFLFFGWGCLFWQPLALQYGKRPVYLISIIATLAIMVWAPYTKTNGQWIANKILQGFFGAPIESLCEASVTDIYFTHERGFYMAMYGLFLAGSNFFAPIIAGFIADGQGWEWVLYWCAIFCGIGFVFLFFFMEETNYDRGSVNRQQPSQPHQTPTSSITSAEDTPKFPALPQTINESEKQIKQSSIPSHTTDIEPGIMTITQAPKSYVSKLRLFEPQTFDKPNKLLGMVLRPLIFLTFPVIAYAGFCYGSSLVWFNVLNGTTSLILGSQPYSFKPSMVGVSYVSPLIGVFVGAAYTGKFGDWFIVRMARSKKGILEPEFRLWLFAASLLLIPLGLILWGVGAAHHVHWFGLVFAMGVIAATNTIGLQISVSYAIESYPDLAGEAIITVIIIRNTMSFAINYGITPWVENMGYQNAFILAACAGVAQVLTFLIFVKWGKRWRRASADRYLRYVEQLREAGVAH